MICPYCKEQMEISKVDPTIFYCWDCEIIGELEPDAGNGITHFPRYINLQSELD